MEVLGFGVGMVANVELAMLNVVSQLGRDQGEEPGEELRAIISGGDGGCLDDDAGKARETSLGIPEVDARGRPLACCGVVLRVPNAIPKRRRPLHSGACWRGIEES